MTHPAADKTRVTNTGNVTADDIQVKGRALKGNAGEGSQSQLEKTIRASICLVAESVVTIT